MPKTLGIVVTLIFSLAVQAQQGTTVRGRVTIASDGAPLPDLPAERTRFLPPAAPAVLLFSDARFDLPTVAPRRTCRPKAL